MITWEEEQAALKDFTEVSNGLVLLKQISMSLLVKFVSAYNTKLWGTLNTMGIEQCPGRHR